MRHLPTRVWLLLSVALLTAAVACTVSEPEPAAEPTTDPADSAATVAAGATATLLTQEMLDGVALEQAATRTMRDTTRSPRSSTPATATPGPRPTTIADILPNLGPAPDITNEVWINSEPLTLAELEGKVVLIEFWTFG